MSFGTHPRVVMAMFALVFVVGCAAGYRNVHDERPREGLQGRRRGQQESGLRGRGGRDLDRPRWL